MKNRVALTMLFAGTALVAGCGKKTPSGQVAATVDGKEVTLQELNTEVQAANVPASADKQTVQRAILQRVIERKLLVEAAEKKGLDKTPDYLAQRRRMEEILLVQTYAKQQATAIQVPNQTDVDTFMKQNANAFADRQQLVLDQIRFPTPANLKQLDGLQQAHNMDQVVETLNKLGIKFERGPAGLDTSNVPPKVMAQINNLPATEPFVVPQPGQITISVIKERRPVAVNPNASRPAAVAAWRQQKFSEMLAQQVAQLKQAAKITYQNGFAPPPTKPAAAGAPAPTNP